MVDGVVPDLLAVDLDRNGKHLDVNERAVLTRPSGDALVPARREGLLLDALRVLAQVGGRGDQPVDDAPDGLARACSRKGAPPAGSTR